ncbi:hypothetical protein ACFXJ8_19810 [Nonomuraea sp. NPDC059194]|uniref:hypothetical protein n=1 Tax=Nonomuraea sp. NPDC059194 TaxID=3346764 RepID=UPI0036A8FF4A
MHFLFWVAAVAVSAWEPVDYALSAERIPYPLPTALLLVLALLALRADEARHRTLALVGIGGTLTVPALAYAWPLLFEGAASGAVATVACVALIAAADLVAGRRPAMPYLVPTIAVAVPFLVAEADLRMGNLGWFSLPDWLAIKVLLSSGALSVLVLAAVATRRLLLRVVTVYTLVAAALVGVAAGLVPLSYGYAEREAAIPETRLVVKKSGEGDIPPDETWIYRGKSGGLVMAFPGGPSLAPLEVYEAEPRLSPFWYTGAYLATAALVLAAGRWRPSGDRLGPVAEPRPNISRP